MRAFFSSSRLSRWQVWAGDIVRDVMVEMDARRAKTALLLAAVTLSTGALVCSAAVSATVRQEVDAGLAASTVDLVAVTPARAQADVAGDGRSVRTLPVDAAACALRLDLVLAAGTRLDATGANTTVVSRRQPGTDGGQEVRGLTLVGMTSGYLDALRATGAPDQRFLLDSARKVVLLGGRAAQDLGVPTSGDLRGVTVWINGEQYSVIGTLYAEGVDLSRTVVVPYELVLASTGNDAQAQLLIRTAPGGGAPVAEVVRLAVRPDAPERLSVSAVVDVSDLRGGVSGAFDRYIAAAGAFLLAVTVLLIANSMIVSVTSRTAEIGLRRAMGASAGDIAAVVLTEGTMLGFCGGIGGSALAACVTVVVSAANGWAAVHPVWALAAGPLLGAVAGLASSVYPAVRAARVQPAVAVRSD